ncbi:MAG: response regulator [Dehalococcoidales bacterium]|nr:response regulator [Dehalococcoidales bacterium]
MMAKTNVLVVDDLRSMRLTLGGILEDKGHNVATVEDGYQAIEAVRKVHFDAIFMDIKMPGINGVQTFREIKKIDPRATVIMMTAYSVEDLVKEALEEGAYAVVYKPFDIDRIVSLIEQMRQDRTLILVVDDQFGDRETLKGILEDKGYRVATAGDGTAAIKMVQEKHFDIIFLDIKLPDISGVETFEQVKKIDPRAAVIMMTGYSEEDLIKRAISGGAYTCIYKPFDMEKVVVLVDKLARK